MSTSRRPTSASGAIAGTWQIDASHSTIEFSVRHLMITSAKEFGGVTGSVTVNEGAAPTVDIVIDAASISTRSEQRDAHLRSADFLDAANHPTLTFRGGRIAGQLDGDFKLVGDLSIRGVTRPVALQVTAEGSNIEPVGQRPPRLRRHGQNQPK